MEAERLVARYDRFLSPGAHNTLIRTIAWGWVRTGDMNRARAALAATGAEGDSSDAAGWLGWTSSLRRSEPLSIWRPGSDRRRLRSTV
jgi:hypothetical protein